MRAKKKPANAGKFTVAYALPSPPSSATTFPGRLCQGVMLQAPALDDFYQKLNYSALELIIIHCNTLFKYSPKSMRDFRLANYEKNS